MHQFVTWMFMVPIRVEHAHKKFNIFDVLKLPKTYFLWLLTLTSSLKSFTNKNIFCPNSKKFLLKISRGIWAITSLTQASLKVLSGHLNLGARLRLIWSGIIMWTGSWQFFKFNDKLSREEHEPILSILRFSEMALSSKVTYRRTVFLVSGKSSFFKILQIFWDEVPLCFILLLLSPTIPEYDLQRTAESQKVTYWGLANSNLQQAGIGKATISNVLWFDGARKSTCYIWKEDFMKPAA